MVVICPKCKTRLKVDEGKLGMQGSRFKCPRCGTFLLVKKPAVLPKRVLDNNKILIAHSNPAVMNEITSLLIKNGFRAITASDGISAMVKAIRELPFLVIIEVGLPKIYGFEVCKRLKMRDETKGMKFLIVTSVYDQKRYKREPASLYGADDYIEEQGISDSLINKIDSIRGLKPEEKEGGIGRPGGEPAAGKTEQMAEPQTKPEALAEKPPFDEKIERAKRLARTILSDIYLYNTAKADQSIRNNNFYSVFAPELKEGLKLYESRISNEVRQRGDFFREAIENFITKKKKGSS